MKGKKVVVTGAGGFIGSHLVERLLEMGAAVRAFVHYNSLNSWGWLDTFPKNVLKEIEVYRGDIRDFSGVREAVKNTDIVFHLAALIGIPYSYYSPDSYVETNIKGTLNVLQASRDASVGRVMVTSTSEVYGTAMSVPIDEHHRKQAQSPYSATKIAADFIAKSFFYSFGLPVTIVRPFNTFGPRQSLRAIIPTIVTQLLSGKREIKLGALQPRRDFVYVKDTVEGFVKIAECGDTIGEEINICTGKAISIGELAQTVVQMLGSKARVVVDRDRLRPRRSEVQNLLGDNTKLRSFTNWTPEHSLEEGLSFTIEWYRQNLGYFKAELYNI